MNCFNSLFVDFLPDGAAPTYRWDINEKRGEVWQGNRWLKVVDYLGNHQDRIDIPLDIKLDRVLNKEEVDEFVWKHYQMKFGIVVIRSLSTRLILGLLRTVSCDGEEYEDFQTSKRIEYKGW